MRGLFLALAALSLASCRGGEEPVPVPTNAQASDASATMTEAPPPQAKAVKRTVENERFSFTYAYPAAAAAIPALKAEFDAEMDSNQAELSNQARDGQKEARSGGFEFHPYEGSTVWTVVTDLPGWLSLKADINSYTGGAHGNHGTTSLLWDRAASRKRAPLDLFVSKAAFDAALRDAYCAALNKERAKRRGEAVNRAKGEGFDKCVAPSEVTVLLGSADKQHFTRIGLVADPYVAGPYAEGEYEVTLPVTAALIRAVRPEYRAAFASGR